MPDMRTRSKGACAVGAYDEEMRPRTVELLTSLPGLMVNALSRGHFDVAANVSGGVMSADQLAAVVADFGRPIKYFMATDGARVNITRIPGVKPPMYDAWVRIDSTDGQPSDLYLEVRLFEGYPGTIDGELLSLARLPHPPVYVYEAATVAALCDPARAARIDELAARRGPQNRTPLHKAADVGDEAAARELLREGADPNARDSWGQTPLHEAASSGALDIALALLEAGAEADAADERGITPLFRAVDTVHRSPEMVAALRARGAVVTDGIRRRSFTTGGPERDLLGDLPAPVIEPPRTEADQLTDAELVAVEAAVVALVSEDEPALRALGAYDYAIDPYEWVKEYGFTPDEHRLTLPPGPAREWMMHVLRYDDGDSGEVHVDMWTNDEPSDLTLILGVRETAEGPVLTFDSLHVL